MAEASKKSKWLMSLADETENPDMLHLPFCSEAPKVVIE